MQENNTKDTSRDTTKESLENGKKAIEVEKKLQPPKGSQSARPDEEAEKKDAEQWRNEG